MGSCGGACQDVVWGAAVVRVKVLHEQLWCSTIIITQIVIHFTILHGNLWYYAFRTCTVFTSKRCIGSSGVTYQDPAVYRVKRHRTRSSGIAHQDPAL